MAGPVAAVVGAVTGAAIAGDATRYQGQGYVYGGDASSPGDWDCSSFVSYVLGHDLGMGLPGGKWGDPGFPPHAHGPVVTSYADWTAAEATETPAIGDLVLWVGSGAAGHIGFVTGPNQMVSALNTDLGTLVSPVQGYGPPGLTPVYRHITAAGGGITTDAAIGGAGLAQAVMGALLLTGALAAAVVGGAVLAAAGLVWLAQRAVSSG